MPKHLNLVSARLLPLSTVLIAGTALAGNTALSTIDDQALSNSHGVTSVNVAAGNGNQQANAAAITITNGQAARAQALIHQSHQGNKYSSTNVSVARIGGGAFANSTGIVSVNQATGNGNAQSNSVAIAVGLNAKAVAESDLAGTSAGAKTSLSPSTPRGVREASIDETAFQGAQGIVQVNQSAGAGNATANHVGLEISVGATP